MKKIEKSTSRLWYPHQSFKKYSNLQVSDGKHKVEGGFTILLVDVNDNPPEFAKSFFDLQISPSAQVDDVIVRITATDRDSGDNGRISYSLDGHEEMFQMSPDGQLLLHF